MRRPPELIFLYALHFLLSLNALVGGGALILDPQGALMELDPNWLQHTPFKTYLVPGLILFIFNGLLPLFALICLLFEPDWHWANFLMFMPISTGPGLIPSTPALFLLSGLPFRSSLPIISFSNLCL